jgi:DNA-binding YbaB/EbfC family protein
MSGFDLGGLTDMLGGFQAKLEQLKSEAAALEATAQAGGGAVKVTATGNSQISAIAISDAAFEDREMLEDLLRAATNEALRKAQEASAAKLAELTAGLPLPPGMLPT